MSMGRDDRVDADAPELACGASYDALVAQAAERRPPRPGGPGAAHQHTCPHCRAALAELDALWAPVHALADQEVRAPVGLLSTVMARVRELPRHRDHALVPTSDHQGGPGTTRVAARVVGAIARTAALQVAGVALAQGGRSRSTPTTAGAGPGTTVGVSGTHVVVELSLVVAAGEAIPSLAARVRQHVGDHVHALTGLTVTQVDVRVVDLA